MSDLDQARDELLLAMARVVIHGNAEYAKIRCALAIETFEAARKQCQHEYKVTETMGPICMKCGAR